MANELMLLGCGPAGADGASSYLLRDTFTDADGTALASHTMDVGGGWTVSGSVWEIQSDRAVSGASYAGTLFYTYATAAAGSADGTITLNVTLAGTGNYAPLIAARYTDTNNHWRLFVLPSQLEIREVTGGVQTSRAAAAFASSNGGTYTMEATLSGQDITLQVGAASCTFNSASHVNVTRHGMAEYVQDSGGNLYNANVFDDFEMVP